MAQTLNAIMREDTFTGVGNLNIFFRAWRPSGHPRGVVVIVHGFNSHSGYYAWTAEQLVSSQFAVYALDLPGRGRSDGPRFFVERFDDYVLAVAEFVGLVKLRESGRAIFLLGHSAGGVISCLYSFDHQAELAGLICESFAYRLPAPDFALAVIKGLSHVAPHARVLHLKNETFSRDPAVLAAMNADPLIAHETQPTQTVAAMVRADERLKVSFPAIGLPLLILHGTADQDARAAGSESFYAEAGSPDKTLKLYDGHFHDLLNDFGKETVMADILSWLDRQVSAANEGHP
jgi:alpha-beta hydrolase superfamily lysophospholipase